MRYVGPARGGAQAGYCFSPSAGGRCRGTPPECLQCNKAITCHSNSGGFGGTIGESGAPGGGYQDKSLNSRSKWGPHHKTLGSLAIGDNEWLRWFQNNPSTIQLV